MAVSKRRIVFRLFLLMIAIGLGAVAYFGWYQGQPDVLKARAQAAIENQEWEKARLILGTLLQKVPNDPEAHLLTADVLVNEAREAEPKADYFNLPPAYDHLLKAWELKPEDEAVSEKLLTVSIQAGRFPEARQVAAELMNEQPRNPDVLYVLLGQAIAEKNHKQAQVLLGQLRDLDGEPRPRTLILEEQLLAATENAEGRKALWNEVLAQAQAVDAKTELSALAELANLTTIATKEGASDAEINQRADGALNLLEQLSERGAKGLAAQKAVELSEVLAPEEGDAQAEDPLRQQLMARTLTLGQALLKDDKSAPQAYREMAQLAKASGNSDQAAKILEQGIQEFAKQKKPSAEAAKLDLHLGLAQHLIAEGHYEAAEPHLEALVGDHRSAGWGHLLKGFVAMNEGRFERALVELNSAQKSLSSTPIVRLALARTLVAMRRWKEALPYLESLQLDPESIPADQREWVQENLGDGSAVHLMLAQAHLALDNPQAAKPHLKALTGTALEPTAIAIEATDLWNAGQKEAATTLIRSARERFGSNVELARLQAIFLEQQGKPEVAWQILGGLARTYSEDINLQILAYQWLRSHGRTEHAAEWLAKLREYHPKEPRLMLLKAQALLTEGKATEALELAQSLEGDATFDKVGRAIGVVAALKMDNLDQAVASIEELQKNQPGSRGLVEILKADVSSAQGDFDAAVASLGDVMEHTNFRSQIAQFMHRALLKLAQEKGAQAAETQLQPLLKAYPDQPMLILTQADLQFQQKQYAQALDTLAQLAQMRPQSNTPAFLAARVMVAQNRREEALGICQEILRRQPDHEGARLLAIDLSLNTNPQTALTLAQAGEKTHPENPSFPLGQALALAQLKRFDEAQQVAEKLQKAKPKLAQSYLVLARIHLAAADKEKALDILAKGQSELPENLALLENRLRILSDLERDEEAQELAETAIAKMGGTLAAKLQFARMFAALKRFDAAEHWANQALQTGEPAKKDQATIHLLLGDVALNQMEASSDSAQKQTWAEKAVAEYKKARALDPPHLVAANNIAWLLATQLDQLDEALEVSREIREAITIAEAPPQILDTLSLVYRRAGQQTDLETLIDQAAASRPNEQKWLVAKVESAVDQADLQKTLKELEQIEKDHPSAAGPSYAKGLLWARLKNPRQALTALNQALERNPGLVEARLLAIDQMERLGRWQSIVEQANLILQQDPDQMNAHLAKAQALKALGQKTALEVSLAESLQLVQKRLEAQPQNPALYLGIAKLHQLAGRPEKAIAQLESALTKNVIQAGLVEELVKLYLAQDEPAKAREVADRVLPQVSGAAELVALGRIFYQTKLYETARLLGQEAQKAAKGTEEQRAVEWLLGDVALAEGEQSGEKPKFLEARDHYQAVLKTQPRHLVAGNNLAWLLLDHLNQPEEALAVGQQVRGDSPVSALHPSFVDTLAKAHRKAGQLEAAQKLLEEALFSHPEQGLLYLELGHVFLESGNRDAARSAFSTALELGLNETQAKEANEKLASLKQ